MEGGLRTPKASGFVETEDTPAGVPLGCDNFTARECRICGHAIRGGKEVMVMEAYQLPGGIEGQATSVANSSPMWTQVAVHVHAWCGLKMRQGLHGAANP